MSSAYADESGGGKPPAGTYYSVKDQPLPPPSTYGRQSRGRKGPKSCLCCLGTLCCILCSLIIALGFAALIFWLVVRPKSPKFDVQNVRISGLTSTNSTSITPVTTFDVVARNPNKKIGIYYDRLDVIILAPGFTVAEGSLPTFYQGHKNTTTIQGNLRAPGGTVNLSSAEQAALLNAQRNRDLPLYVAINAKIRVKIGSWKSSRYTVKVRCYMQLDPSRTTGSQIVNKSCKVRS